VLLGLSSVHSIVAQAHNEDYYGFHYVVFPNGVPNQSAIANIRCAIFVFVQIPSKLKETLKQYKEALERRLKEEQKIVSVEISVIFSDFYQKIKRSLQPWSTPQNQATFKLFNQLQACSFECV